MRSHVVSVVGGQVGITTHRRLKRCQKGAGELEAPDVEAADSDEWAEAVASED